MVDQIILEEDEIQPSGQMSAIAIYCKDLHTEYQSTYRQRKLDEIADNRRKYDGDRDDKSFPWENCSNKSMGLPAIAVDNLDPRVYNKLVAEDDFVQVKPTTADDIDKTDDVKEFMHWACHNNMRIAKKLKPVLHDLLIDGTKDVICFWEEKGITLRMRGEVPIFVDQAGERVKPPEEFLEGDPQEIMQRLMAMGIMPAGSEEGVKEKKDKDFKVNFEALKIEDCFFPDHNDNWDDQPYLRYIYPTLGSLKKLQDQGVYKNISNKLVKGTKRDTTDDEDRKDIEYSEYGQECHLLECYLKWKDEWRIVTFSMDNNWEEVRNQKLSDVFWHDHKPIRRFRIYQKSNESMGTGIPKKIEHFDTGINDLYNLAIDCATIEAAPIYFYNESSTGMFSSGLKKLVPGAGVGLPKDSQVHFPNKGNGSQGFVVFINLLLTFFERTLSLMDYSAGTRSSTTGQGGDTASGMAMILQEGNIKHNYTGESLQDTFADILTDCLSLYAQYIPMDAKIRLFEKNEWVFKPVDIHAIQGRYDLRVDVSDASSNTMTNRNDALALMNSTKDMPMVNQIQNIEDLYRSFGKKDVEKYIQPQFAQIIGALIQAPELGQPLMQMIGQFMQKKSQEENDNKIRSQARANIHRQELEREEERPFENKKIVDQANEGFKRKTIGKVVEQIGGLDNN